MQKAEDDLPVIVEGVRVTDLLIGKAVHLVLCHDISKESLQRRIRTVLTKYDYNTCNLAASYTDGYKKILPKYIIDEYCPYTFEGHTVMGIKNYDPYLKCMYGDYMTIPPVEKRIQHNFDYLDLNTPYREFKEEK